SAEGCLDWYHVVEKLWEVGRFLHADDSAALTRWVDARKKLLREGKIWQLIDGLAHLRRQVPNTGPGTKTSASGSTTSFSTLVNMPTTCATIAFGKTAWTSAREPSRVPSATSSPCAWTVPECAGGANAP